MPTLLPYHQLIRIPCRLKTLCEDMLLIFSALNLETARDILAWRYEPPYDFYNPDSDKLESDLRTFLAPENRYYAIWDEGGTLIGHCCFGDEAQVQGGDYSQKALDIGMGLCPDRTSQGLGSCVIGEVIEFAQQNFQAKKLRATVAAFNQRALRAWKKVGFYAVSEFVRPSDNQQFAILMWNG